MLGTLPFLDRRAELDRLRRAISTPGALACVYGRRRLGKSRLLLELLRDRPAVYYVGDDRDAPLQRHAVARAIAGVLPGFDEVTYPDWDVLLERWWREAPGGAVLAFDELPGLVTASPELASVLQKHVDRRRGPSTIVCGSSQRMMHGLVLDGSAPLYGRARAILRLTPLGFGWLQRALRIRSAGDAVEHWSVWGGAPRYWELAAEHDDLWEAIGDLVLDPAGVLHREPERLLLDDMQDVARAASVLAVIGQGAHRAMEIGGRLVLPATSLSRPLARLVDLDLIQRELPFGRSLRDTKRTLYRIADPFLRFWFRFVEPNRSRLEAGQVRPVLAEVRLAWRSFLGAAWEDLARSSVARLRIAGRTWKPAARWWGRTPAGPLELDIVAEAEDDPRELLVGEAKLALDRTRIAPALASLAARAAGCPDLAGRNITPVLWLVRAPGRRRHDVVTATELGRVLR